MSYQYEVERPKLFTEAIQGPMLKLHVCTLHLLAEAGAVSMGKLTDTIEGTGDDWTRMAMVDRLVELGYIGEIDRGPHCAGQYRVFVKVGE